MTRGAALGHGLVLASLLAPACSRDAAKENQPEPPAFPDRWGMSTAGAVDAAEKRVRRERLARLAGPDAAVLVMSADDSPGFTGSTQNSDFTYLCPFEARGAAVLLTLGPRTDAATPPAIDDRLYLRAKSPAGELWTGAVACPGDEAGAAGRFDAALLVDRLANDVADLAKKRTTLWVSAGGPADGPRVAAPLVAALRARLPGTWVRMTDVPGSGPDDLAESIRRALPDNLPRDKTPLEAVAALPALDVKSAGRLISEMREVKSPEEIARIRAAVRATADGMRDALAVAAPGMREMEIAARVEVRCRLAGCARQAYPSIVGSGPNSCTLHYAADTRVVADGDLVVMDIGGEYRGYAADVTRTFPVSGHFTEEQAKVYDAVLAAQLAAIDAVRPGATLKDVHQAAAGVLKARGLDQYFPHGTSHSVGLDVHDPYRKDVPLRAGCVITVEPGVYIAARSIGVRIEDTVLVTETGCEVLSAGIGKTRAEIEKLLERGAPSGAPLPR